jgi:hypothetical protein
MKRASIKSAITPLNSTARQDVTDRLLGPTASEQPDARPPHQRRRTGAKSAEPAQTEAPGYTPDDTKKGHTSPAATALELTRQALEALKAAQDTAPARYELGVRYRLDALAHHLEQVSQFILGQAV